LEKVTERAVAQPEVSIMDQRAQFAWGTRPMEQPGRIPVSVTARPVVGGAVLDTACERRDLAIDNGEAE